jgi:hypothetical protein
MGVGHSILARRATAYHEAGHAVAMATLSLPFDSVHIFRRANGDGLSGYVLHDKDIERQVYEDRGSRVCAVVCITGPLAEARYLRKSMGTIWGGQDAVDVAKLRLSDTDLKRAFREAATRVERHWTAVKRVARALQHHGALDYDAVEGLVWPPARQS